MPRSRRPSHAGPPRERRRTAASHAASSPATVAPVKLKPVPVARVGHLVDDRVGESADPMHDRRGPVAERDHLALAARLEARRHREEVGAGVDLAGHHPVEALDERHPRRVGRGDRPERVGQLRVTAALDDEPHPTLEQGRRGPGEQVEPLLRIEPPDHPDHRAVVVRVEPDAGQQIRPAVGLAAPIRARIRRGLVRIGRRVPDRRVESVEDPEEPVALRPQGAVEAHPEGGRQRLGRETRRDRVDQLRALDPAQQQVDPVGVGRDDAVPERQTELAKVFLAASSHGRRGCGG